MFRFYLQGQHLHCVSALAGLSLRALSATQEFLVKYFNTQWRAPIKIQVETET